ncbi:MAG: hypothetical protein MJ180_00995 [Candidatus Gastranaerophilales bacterium]|nr:hypothetical protein [Candidatus Gastranaerophilales bacterium]
MKKIFIIMLFISILTTGVVYAAKYQVNTTGTVKSNGKVVAPSSVPAPQRNYNVYDAQTYVNTKQVNALAVPYVEIVMDYSGSMSNWIGAAKNAMSAIVAQIPASTNIGFRVFGHDYNGSNPSNNKVLAQVSKIVKQNGKYKVQTKPSPLGTTTGYCAATKQVTKVMPANTTALLSGMNSVNIGGATPLVYGLDRAINEDFAMFDRSSAKKIVLITDGGENCGGNPCEYAKQLIKTRRDVHVDVVLVSYNSDMDLQCLANVTGGNLYRITDLSDLLQTVTQSINSTPQNTPAQTPQSQEQQYEYYNE